MQFVGDADLVAPNYIFNYALHFFPPRYVLKVLG